MTKQQLFTHGSEHAAATDLARFVMKVDTSSDCWIWRGTRDTDGYGVFKISKRMFKAHRLAFLYAFGWLPAKGSFICHKCDNRACVNPGHLFAGLPRDNSFDMVSKGRSARGERDSAAKLTSAKVQTILQRLDTGHAKRAIARDYGVSDTAIRSIALGKTWRHVHMGGL